MQQFKTKGEAEEAKSQRAKKPLGFCPIIRGKCRTDCICYIERPPHGDCDAWYLYPNYCNYVLINGHIIAQN